MCEHSEAFNWLSNETAKTSQLTFIDAKAIPGA